MSVRLLLAVVLLASPLSACGRKGPLELPPEAAELKGPDGQRITPAQARKDRPFVLDPLVK
jgi:predicted small lipoprotein YifL